MIINKCILGQSGSPGRMGMPGRPGRQGEPGKAGRPVNLIMTKLIGCISFTYNFSFQQIKNKL